MPGFLIAKTVCRCHCKVSRKFEAAAWVVTGPVGVRVIQFNSIQSDLRDLIRFGLGHLVWFSFLAVG